VRIDDATVLLSVASKTEQKQVLLTHRFTDPQLNLTLELFVRMVTDIIGERLVSVLLYGSIVFDDLAPGYGDLDFLAVVANDLTNEDCQQLAELRKLLRTGDHGVLAAMIEGAFLPRQMLDPVRLGCGYWWGTRGERPLRSNELGWLVLHQIRELGIVIWGQDIRRELPQIKREQLLQQVGEVCQSMEEHGKGGGLHAVDWLLTAARELLLLKEGRLSSKSEAADWAYRHAEGDWRNWLPHAKQLRLHPTLAESADSRQWLAGLTTPIEEACQELRRELAKHRRW
jgi:hypothetical protein